MKTKQKPVVAHRISQLKDVPYVLGGVTHLAASNTRRKRIVANTDLLVDPSVGEVILSLRHGADDDAETLVFTEGTDVLTHIDSRSLPAQRDFATVRRKILGDRVLDDLEEFLRAGGGSDRQLVQQLHHETSETFKGTRYAYGWVHLDQNPLCGLDVHLQLAGFVDRRVEKGQKALLKGPSKKNHVRKSVLQPTQRTQER